MATCGRVHERGEMPRDRRRRTPPAESGQGACATSWRFEERNERRATGWDRAPLVSSLTKSLVAHSHCRAARDRIAVHRAGEADRQDLIVRYPCEQGKDVLSIA